MSWWVGGSLRTFSFLPFGLLIGAAAAAHNISTEAERDAWDVYCCCCSWLLLFLSFRLRCFGYGCWLRCCWHGMHAGKINKEVATKDVFIFIFWSRWCHGGWVDRFVRVHFYFLGLCAAAAACCCCPQHQYWSGERCLGRLLLLCSWLFLFMSFRLFLLCNQIRVHLYFFV